MTPSLLNPLVAKGFNQFTLKEAENKRLTALTAYQGQTLLLTYLSEAMVRNLRGFFKEIIEQEDVSSFGEIIKAIPKYGSGEKLSNGFQNEMNKVIDDLKQTPEFIKMNVEDKDRLTEQLKRASIDAGLLSASYISALSGNMGAGFLLSNPVRGALMGRHALTSDKVDDNDYEAIRNIYNSLAISFPTLLTTYMAAETGLGKLEVGKSISEDKVVQDNHDAFLSTVIYSLIYYFVKTPVQAKLDAFLGNEQNPLSRKVTRVMSNYFEPIQTAPSNDLLNSEDYKKSKHAAYRVEYRNPEEHRTSPLSLADVSYINKQGKREILNAEALNFSEKSFQAFNKLFKHLDMIFRGKGNKYIPQQHSSTADHTIGLMHLADDFAFSKVPDSLKDLVSIPKIRAGLLAHDFGEIPGEISTMFQRLEGKENDNTGKPITEKSRQLLESKVVALLFYKSLELVYTGDNSFFNDEFSNLQQRINHEQNQYERYRTVDKMLQDHGNELNNIYTAFDINVPATILAEKHTDFKSDLKSLIDAYKVTLEPMLTEAQNDQAFDKKKEVDGGTPLIWSIIKFFDKAEAELYVSDVAIIKDKKDLSSYLKKPKKLFDNIITQTSSNLKNVIVPQIVKPLQKLLTDIEGLYKDKAKGKGYRDSVLSPEHKTPVANTSKN